MLRALEKLVPLLVALSALAFGAAMYLVFFQAPIELSMGVVQKIFYVHVPAAMVMYAGFALASLASLFYLIRPNRVWDMVALSGAEVGLLFCVYVLFSGPLWAYKAWGVAWTWDPQLTATFVIFILYMGYVLLRTFSGSGERVRKIAAVLAVIAALDIPIIHYAVRQWGGLHPVVEREGGGGLDPQMKLAFSAAMLAFLGLFVVLLWLRLRLRLTERGLDQLYLDVEDAAHVLGRR